MNDTEFIYVVVASTQERYGIRKTKAAVTEAPATGSKADNGAPAVESAAVKEVALR